MLLLLGPIMNDDHAKNETDALEMMDLRPTLSFIVVIVNEEREDGILLQALHDLKIPNKTPTRKHARNSIFILRFQRVKQEMIQLCRESNITI